MSRQIRSTSSRSATGTAALVLTLLALLGVGACASGNDGGLRVNRPFAKVIVENDSNLTVNVYAVRQGTRQRLGQVTSYRSREFPVRRSMLTSGTMLQLMVDPIGSPTRYFSHSIPVSEDETVRLQVSALIR